VIRDAHRGAMGDLERRLGEARDVARTEQQRREALEAEAVRWAAERRQLQAECAGLRAECARLRSFRSAIVESVKADGTGPAQAMAELRVGGKKKSLK
jgi:chromosome segregation ATPase